MTNCTFLMRWIPLAAVASLYSVGCSKPEPNAPTKDFARRHHCSENSVESEKEASNRMRVTGCGESEVYVHSCENRGVGLQVSESRQPITEAEAKHNSPRQPPLGEPGCAWTRQQNTATPRANGAQQPKWLSDP